MPDQTDQTLQAAAPATSHLAEVEKVSRDLRKLLEGCEGVHLKADIKAQIENLNAWTDAYLNGLNAVQKLTEIGVDTLHDAQKELALSLEEYLRLEDEGGNPATAEQQRRTDEVSRALRRINMLIPAFDTTFAEGEPQQPEPEIQPDQPEVPAQPQQPEYVPDQPDIPPVTQPEMLAPKRANAA